VAEATEINWQLIDNINQERYPTQQKIKYLKCPVCQMLMDRVNFGYRSGVVVDQCRLHGIWLDNGEITHLMEWKKAGGQLGAQQQKLQTREERKNLALDLHRDVNLHSYSRQNADAESDDLLKTLSDVVATLLHHSF
jgi:Zn-finger nucleic acid-binding protein